MSDHRTDIANAKAQTTTAIISLLTAMKRLKFDQQENAADVEEAFAFLTKALRVLNGDAP